MNEFTPIPKWDIPCPEDGVYENMPNEDYHRIDALNASTVKAFCQSGIHGEHSLYKPNEGAAALWFGSAFHSALLEPEDFEARVHHYEDTGIGPTAEVAHKRYLEDHPDAIAMRKGWAEQIGDMTNRINSHPACPYMLHGTEGQNELTFIWRVPLDIDGQRVLVPCRARADRFIPAFSPYEGADEVAGIIDLKTCRDSSPNGFERDIGNYSYHIQAAWYLAGAIACGRLDKLHDNCYTIIAVEKSPPHPVGVYPINTASLQYGVQECWRGMRAYVKYRMHGHAEGPTDTKIPMGLPVWAMPDNTTAR